LHFIIYNYNVSNYLIKNKKIKNHTFEPFHQTCCAAPVAPSALLAAQVVLVLVGESAAPATARLLVPAICRFPTVVLKFFSLEGAPPAGGTAGLSLVLGCRAMGL
jgi:hypothetical protein